MFEIWEGVTTFYLIRKVGGISFLLRTPISHNIKAQTKRYYNILLKVGGFSNKAYKSQSFNSKKGHLTQLLIFSPPTLVIDNPIGARISADCYLV